MKKIVLFSGLLFLSSITFSQNNNRTSAIMALKNGYVSKAKGYIDKAVVHEKTKEDAKTWFYYAQIYGAIAMSKEEDLQEFKESAPEEALKGLRNTMKFDDKGDYKNDIRQAVAPMYSMALNQGIKLYQDGKYEEALEAFKGTQELAGIIEITDSVGIFNAAISAKALGKNQEAIDYYKKCTEIGYGGSDPYLNLISLYGKENDTVNAEAIIMLARKNFPSDAGILLEQTRFYIGQGQSEKAEADLRKTVEADPKNVSLRHALGVVYEQINEFDKAVEAYKKALEIEPEHKNSTKNLGLAYNTMASKVNDEMNALPFSEQDKYETLKSERDSLLKEGLPYLEKSYAQEENADMKRVLNSVYAVLKMDKKIE